MSVHEYNLNFTQLSRYASEMVADMSSRMSLFVAGLSRQSTMEGKATVMTGYMDLTRLIFHVQQIEKYKLNDKIDFKNMRSKKTVNEFRKKKSNANRSSLQTKTEGVCSIIC